MCVENFASHDLQQLEGDLARYTRYRQEEVEYARNHKVEPVLAHYDQSLEIINGLLVERRQEASELAERFASQRQAREKEPTAA